jgi:hypothetical protein
VVLLTLKLVVDVLEMSRSLDILQVLELLFGLVETFLNVRGSKR